MKSKQAERAKKKRRVAKAEAKRIRENKIYSAFLTAAEGKHIKPYKRQEVLKAYRALETETTVKAIVYSVVATLYVLHTVYRWGTIKIVRQARSIYRYINVVSDEKRSIPQMAEELHIDAGLDVYSLFGKYEPYSGQSKDKQKIVEICAMVGKISDLLPMIMYSLYYDEGWKSKRMNRFGSEVRNAIIDMLENDCFEKMRKCLETECRLRVSKDGDISYIKPEVKNEKT